MCKVTVVAIQKLDVLMEDFSYVLELIQNIAADKKKLIECRNSWEVIFSGYDDDPREVVEIPEIVNWMEKSIDAGIPWFYFMRCNNDSIGLKVFMTACSAEPDPHIPERYLLDRDKLLLFAKKNLHNLEVFADQYHIPEDISHAAADDVMKFISNAAMGTFDQEQTKNEADKDQMMEEAIERLVVLEKQYGINPKIRKYFEEGKLYYSYITGSGFIGSIDTINYDERYAKIVEAFQKQTSFLVYHVIEHGDTISLLFVGNDRSEWPEERPTSAGVMAQVVQMDSYENECGYIKLDMFQGALIRIDNTVYPTMPNISEGDMALSEIDSEIVERLEILKNAGLETDLDVAKIYIHERELCFSELQSVFGINVCVVNRLSVNSRYQHYETLLSKQIPQQLYFLMISEDHKLVFLYVSEEPEKWELEKLALEKNRPYAIVVDTDNMTASIERISYKMVNGGPLAVLDRT